MANTTAQSEVKKYSVALDEFPEFAAQVGIIISCFAIIESYIHQLLGRLTGISQPDAFIFAGSFTGFGARVDLLESLAKSRKQSDQEAKIALHFVGLLRQVAHLRNRYAHAQYSITFEGGSYSPTAKKLMHIDTRLFEANRKPEKVVRDLSQIQKEVEQIKLIICEIHAYLYRNETPVMTSLRHQKL